MVTPRSNTRRREQINLVLQSNSPLATRLSTAEKETGLSRTQIVREIVDAFLEPWMQAELAKQTLLRTVAVDPPFVPTTRLTPRDRQGYRPEPGLARTVAARHHLPSRIAGDPRPIIRAKTVRYPVRARPPSASRNVADDEA